jgi:N utilization substance protein A
METGYDSLVRLPGIGISVADALFEKGFLSAEELASANVADLTSIRGIGEEKAVQLIESAKLAVQTSDQGTSTKPESTSPDKFISDESIPDESIPDESIPDESKSAEVSAPKTDNIKPSGQSPPAKEEKAESDDNLNDKQMTDKPEGKEQQDN